MRRRLGAANDGLPDAWREVHGEGAAPARTGGAGHRLCDARLHLTEWSPDALGFHFRSGHIPSNPLLGTSICCLTCGVIDISRENVRNRQLDYVSRMFIDP